MSSGSSCLTGPAKFAKTVLLAIAIVLCATSLVGCSGKLTPAGGRTRSAIDAEAQQQAEQYWGGLLTKCGGTIYGKDNREAVDLIYEFRDISIRIKPRVLSDADTMNGIEWSGNGYLDSNTSRVLTKDKWGPWRQGSIYQNSEKMEKVHGQWKFGVMEGAPAPLRTFDCSELPH